MPTQLDLDRVVVEARLYRLGTDSTPVIDLKIREC